ncbi:MAG: 8-amino-7-oxononanoate synthase, partial [Bacteroidota bacterium]
FVYFCGMAKIESYLRKRLEKRAHNQSLRELTLQKGRIDFCSNDYLGFAKNEQLRKLSADADLTKVGATSVLPNGSTGSRLISGHSALAAVLESELAEFHQAEAALLFNSGYDANMGLLSCLTGRHDTIIYDSLAHASIRDGIRLAAARSFSFQHNDLTDLEKKLGKATGHILVVVESVYSMDGDEAPLAAIADLCTQFDAALIVDEAHATGVFGTMGQGLVQQLGLERRVWARVHTFGKALGSHGAAVLGSSDLKQYLINYSRPLIYTTALPPHSLLAIRAGYALLRQRDWTTQLHARIDLFLKGLSPNIRRQFISSRSPIQSWVLGGNEQTKAAARSLQAHGFDVRAILHPTVPKGSERLRICLHRFNTPEEIKGLLTAIHQYSKTLSLPVG